MNSTEALKLAIDTQDAIRNFVGSHGQEDTATFLLLEADSALSAVRAALAQPQPSAPLPVTMSGVAQYKARDLVARGYTIVGYTMTKPGDRTAVLIDAAVRWLTPEQQHTLMFVESSDVVAQPSAAPLSAREPLSDAQIARVQRDRFKWMAKHTSYNGGMSGETWDRESGHAVMLACAEAWGITLAAAPAAQSGTKE